MNELAISELEQMWSRMSRATMVAAATILKADGRTGIDADRLTHHLKQTLIGQMDRINAEWRQALEAPISDGWFNALATTQALELAQAAIAAYDADQSKEN